MSWMQVLLYAIIQGITELFPISSVGHAVIVPYLFGWSNITNDPQFLPFVVMLHLGTGVALIIYFWRDWVRLIGSLFNDDKSNRRLLFLIVVATIPAAVIGKVFEHRFRDLFPSALSAGVFLMLNGLVLLFADRLRRRGNQKQLGTVTYGKSFWIGVAQVFALIPGFSRSGITMAAGLGVGLSYEAAARFSFLLATPIILGAGVLEVPKALHQHSDVLKFGLIGGVLTGIIAFLSTHFLMKYFRNHEVQALRPFGRYCLGFGAIVAIAAALGLHL
jgi:undecaprenyl-diphosphatase